MESSTLPSLHLFPAPPSTMSIGNDATIRPRGPKRQLSLPYVPKFTDTEDEAGALTPRAPPSVQRSSSCNTHRPVTPGSVGASAALLKTPTIGSSTSAPITIPGRQTGASPSSAAGGPAPPVPRRRYTDPDELELLALSDAHLSSSRPRSNSRVEPVVLSTSDSSSSSSSSSGSRRSSKRISVPVPQKGVRAILGWPEARALEAAAGSGAVEIWHEYESACEAMLCAFERLDMPAVMAALEEYWRNLGETVQWKLNMTPDLKDAYSHGLQLLLESFLRELDSHISDPPVESLCKDLVSLGSRFDVVLSDCMRPLRLSPEFANDLVRLGARFGQCVVSIVGIWEQIAEVRSLSTLRSVAWLSKSQVKPNAVSLDASSTTTALSPRPPRPQRPSRSPPRMETILEPKPEGLKIITAPDGVYLAHVLAEGSDGGSDEQEIVVPDSATFGVLSSPQSAWSVDTKIEDDVGPDVTPAVKELDATVVTHDAMGAVLLDDFLGFESSTSSDDDMQSYCSLPELRSQRSLPKLLPSHHQHGEDENNGGGGIYMGKKRSNGLSRAPHIRAAPIRCG